VGGILSVADLAAYSATWAEPVTLHLTASNLTMYSVPPPGSGAVLAAILNIIQHSDNFQVRKGHAEPDRQQQPDLVQHAPARQRSRPGCHTQHHPAFRQLPGT
jgi:gamma-glutamyltranspeptidase